MANWVSAGCGVIANELAQAMEKRGQKLYGVVNRTQEKAVAFAKKYGVQNVFTSFEEVCADPAVDIIYISTPHNFGWFTVVNVGFLLLLLFINGLL